MFLVGDLNFFIRFRRENLVLFALVFLLSLLSLELRSHAWLKRFLLLSLRQYRGNGSGGARSGSAGAGILSSRRTIGRLVCTVRSPSRREHSLSSGEDSNFYYWGRFRVRFLLSFLFGYGDPMAVRSSAGYKNARRLRVPVATLPKGELGDRGVVRNAKS